VKEEGTSLSECRGAVMGKGGGVRLRDIALAMGGMRRMAGSASLRVRADRPARQLIRRISRRALRQAKGQPDPLKKNRKNK